MLRRNEPPTVDFGCRTVGGTSQFRVKLCGRSRSKATISEGPVMVRAGPYKLTPPGFNSQPVQIHHQIRRI